MTLDEYITDTRDVLKDPNSNFYTDTQLTRWVNKGRQKAAQIAQCVRYMPAWTGSVISITVTNGGSGYAAADVVISAPDAVDGRPTRATATAAVSAGMVSTITVAIAGSGYVAVPTVTITDPTGSGSGATATATLSVHTTTIAGQEIYPFSTFDPMIELVPGLGEILGIQSVSVSWGNQRPTCDYLDFSTMQAYLRATSIGMQNFPQAWSQFGQGSLGSIYFWPVPAQIAQLELDCYCNVLALSATQTTDLIPDLFSDAVPYYAAHLAYLNAQRYADSQMMDQMFMRKLQEARAAATPSRIPTMYPNR